MYFYVYFENSNLIDCIKKFFQFNFEKKKKIYPIKIKKMIFNYLAFLCPWHMHVLKFQMVGYLYKPTHSHTLNV